MLSLCPYCPSLMSSTSLKRHIQKANTKAQPKQTYKNIPPITASHVSSKSPKYGEFRLCVCDGSNENCRYCDGSGRISLEQIATSSSHIGEHVKNSVSQEIAEPVFCPQCQIRLGNGKLDEHLAAQHRKITSSHFKNVGQGIRKPFNKSSISVPPATLVYCPQCTTKVRFDRLDKHLKKVHSLNQPKSRGRTKNVKGTTNRELTANIDSKSDLRYERAQDVRRMDHTHLYAHPFRELGRYGSHPSHDGFDDESKP
jgi:hypothetical protein